MKNGFNYAAEKKQLPNDSASGGKHEAVAAMKKRSVKEKAGVIAYRLKEGEEPLVLVVSTRKVKGQWVFPVGSVEKGETLATAARRECEEESGYCVEIGYKFSSFQVTNDTIHKRFTFFLATVVGEVEQWETDRQRRWLPVSTIVDALPDVFRDVAGKAVKRIGKGAHR
jgi:8-oxo-dGTP pyrophosphatase MutT (NUDIX family)